MDKPLIEVLARRAGLARALAEFPDCVMAAAAQAPMFRDNGPGGEVQAPTDPAIEPWPPMKAGDGA